ncbi:MAG: sugar ABC transporter permease [Treponemataceae bacterium]|nr:sugar ABC transporter permease [Treponemataceae bacterium]
MKTENTPALSAKPKPLSAKFRHFINSDNTVGYLFALPFIVGFLGFTVIPMFVSLYFSFTKYNVRTPPVWIGFDNYVRMFTKDTRILKSLWVTFHYVIISVPLKLAFALFIAFLLTRKKKLESVFRAIYYLPSLIGGSVAVTLVWKELFSSTGLVNSMIQSIGLPEVSWFGDERFAVWPLILLTVWQFGSSMIIFAAGLKQIPTTYYEAAKIDGAGNGRIFFSITLPSLSPIILFNLVMQLISGFMTFTQSYIISGGSGRPNDSTNFFALYIYNQAFNYFDMGYASALAWILLLIIGAVTFLVFKTSNAWVFYEYKD